MNSITNQPKIQNARKITQITFFGAIILIIFSFIAVTAAPDLIMNSVLPCLILPAALGLTVYSVRLTNRWMRPPRPEDAIEDGLRAIGKRGIMYHYWKPADHILVAPQGVFTLTAHYRAEPLTYDGEWQTKSGFRAQMNELFKQEGVGDIFLKAQEEAGAVQSIIDEIAPEVTVRPVVIFHDPNMKFKIVQRPPVPVVYADEKRKPSLITYVREVAREQEKRGMEPQTLTDEQRQAFERALGIPPKGD